MTESAPPLPGHFGLQAHVLLGVLCACGATQVWELWIKLHSSDCVVRAVPATAFVQTVHANAARSRSHVPQKNRIFGKKESAKSA